jgi:hypothetical protein
MLLANGMYTVKLRRKYLMWNEGEVAGFTPQVAKALLAPARDTGLPWAEDWQEAPPVQSIEPPAMPAVAMAQSQQEMAAVIRDATAPLMAMIAALQEKVHALESGSANGKK